MKDQLTCVSCGNVFSGNYCNVCGEKVILPEDRKLKRYIVDIINALTFADNKLWRTLKTMLVTPGKLSNAFVEGKRKKYMKPVAIFFLANLVYFLVPFINTFTTNLHFQTNSRFLHSQIATQWVEKAIEKRDISLQQYTQLYDTKTTELSKLLLIVMVGLMAIFFRAIHLGSKRSLIADHVTASLELMAFILIYVMQAMSILFILIILVIPFDLQFLFSNLYLTSFSVLLLLYFFFNLERNFYAFGIARSIANAIICVLSIGIALELYRGFLFFITFWSI